MKIETANTDSVILAELGNRLARTRLERNLDQRSLATEAGVSKSTVERIESGDPVRTSSLIRVLRALDLIAQLDQLVPEPLPSPLERLKTKGRQRRRASGRRGAGGDRREDHPAGEWSWADPPQPTTDG